MNKNFFNLINDSNIKLNLLEKEIYRAINWLKSYDNYVLINNNWQFDDSFNYLKQGGNIEIENAMDIIYLLINLLYEIKEKNRKLIIKCYHEINDDNVNNVLNCSKLFINKINNEEYENYEIIKFGELLPSCLALIEYKNYIFKFKIEDIIKQKLQKEVNNNLDNKDINYCSKLFER